MGTLGVDEAAALPDLAGLWLWPRPQKDKDTLVGALERVQGLVAAPNTPTAHGTRHYILRVDSVDSRVGDLRGFVNVDPTRTAPRVSELQACRADPPSKRRRVLLSTDTRRDLSPTERVLASLEALERDFEYDPSKARLLAPIWGDDVDPSPIGLAMLGSQTFEPLFRTYRALCSDRSTLFAFAARRLTLELGRLDDAALDRLEEIGRAHV